MNRGADMSGVAYLRRRTEAARIGGMITAHLDRPDVPSGEAVLRGGHWHVWVDGRGYVRSTDLLHECLGEARSERGEIFSNRPPLT